MQLSFCSKWVFMTYKLTVIDHSAWLLLLGVLSLTSLLRDLTRLFAASSLLHARAFSSCRRAALSRGARGSPAELLPRQSAGPRTHGTWDRPRPGVGPAPPALAGMCLTAGPAATPWLCLWEVRSKCRSCCVSPAHLISTANMTVDSSQWRC